MLRLGMARVCALVAALAAPARAANADVVWSADPGRSEVTLSVSRLLFARIDGTLPIASARIVTADGVLAPLHVDVVLDAAALTTHDAKRDADLRSDRFFDVTRYPTITFVSERVTATGPHTFSVDGQLTMRGISRPIAFDTRAGDVRTGAHGERQVRYDAAGRFRRSDYGMTSARGFVGDVVTLHVAIEAGADERGQPRTSSSVSASAGGASSSAWSIGRKRAAGGR